MNRSIAWLSLGAFMASATTRICDSLLPQLADEFAVPVSAAAMSITAFTLGYGLFQLVYGGIGARLGPYRTAVIAISASAAGTLACAFASDLFWLTLGRFFSGLTIAAVIPMSMVYIGETVAYEDRQPVIARFLLGGVFGGIFGQAFAGLFAEWLSWRQLFLALGMTTMATALAMVIELRSGHVRNFERAADIPNLFGQYARVLRVPWARIVLLTVTIEGFLCAGTFPYVAPYLHAAFDLSYLAIGAVMSCFGFGSLVFILFVRKLHRRLGERGLVLGGGMALIAGFALVAVAGTVGLVALAAGIAGFGFYMMHNTLQTNGTQMASFDRSAAIALFAFCLFIGQAAGTMIMGPIAEWLGYPVIFMMAGSGLLVLALFFRNAKADREAAQAAQEAQAVGPSP
ncbi:MAG: MFS transporter [Geminicoccaceae bacterium]|nr:MFS transporter [Geminicoccaceae bacterium]